MFSYFFFILDLYWKIFDLIYIYIDVFGVEILATASDLLFFYYPLFYYIIVGVMLPKLISFSTVVIFRGIKFIYVFWNAIELFTKSD